MPASGEVAAYRVEAGRKYEVDVRAPVREVAEQDDALLITFDDGGQLVLRGFQDAVAADDTTEISVDGTFMTLREFADGMALAGDMSGTLAEVDAEAVEEIVQSEAETRGDDAQLAALAQELSEIEPAAGEGGGGGRGGFGFQSAVRSAPLNAPDAIGPIGPTALQFGTPEPEEPLRILEEDSEDPTGPNRPGIEFSDEQVYEDGSVLVEVFAQSNKHQARLRPR